MPFIIAILALLVFVIVCVKEGANKRQPPINDLNEHIKHIASLPNKKERQKYLKNRKMGEE